MAILLYQSALLAGVTTDITAGGIAGGGTYLLTVCNRSAGAIPVSIAITTGGEPTDASWLEYLTPVPAAGSGKNVLSRHPVPLGEGWRVFVRASGDGLAVNLIGREE
ncbi:hypothetical protein [Pseudochelatococcus contaminans]|uniref:Uncharacterized protein n=1 Tax=Pseudochelatococcus contaminans TaxID=1538103 RepID=A0A7W6EIV1_9HYPH|nr:hypothetical protein [Pseudochelatococcus contaminans]MBB3811473.1 hypothetical protein [Pseudochelatococcus contaminans]